MELNQKDMFRYAVNPNDAAKKKTAKPSPNDASRPNLPVVNRAAHIQEELLPQVYNELAKHLTKMGVEPQIYMIRWIRCMLSREFRLSQTLIVWDTLFGYHSKNNPSIKTPTLHFLDYLCVAMLIYVSEQLLDRDESGMIMGRLIRYPPIEDVTTLIRLAHEEVVPIVKGIKKQSSNARGLFKANPPDKRGVNQRSQIHDEESSPDAKVILFGAGVPSSSTNKTVIKIAGSGDDVLSNPLARGPAPTKQQTPIVIANKPKEEENIAKKIGEDNEKALKNINDIIQLIKQENDKFPSISLSGIIEKLNDTKDVLKNQSEILKNLR